MANRWTPEEERTYRDELAELYIAQNKTIGEIGKILCLNPSSVYDRLKRLGIPSSPERKIHYLNQRLDVKIPATYSDDLAEFFGIMLGDGHLAHFQVCVTLGKKELSYAKYVANIMAKIFGPLPGMSLDANKDRTVYLGSVAVSSWLASEGLVSNKIRMQVGVPLWIFTEPSYMRRFVRGFFDTDGSVYRLKFGVQISFTNYAKPLLASLQVMLRQLGYRVSEISGHRFYITRIPDIARFLTEIGTCNQKHADRFEKFLNEQAKK